MQCEIEAEKPLYSNSVILIKTISFKKVLDEHFSAKSEPERFFVNKIQIKTVINILDTDIHCTTIYNCVIQFQLQQTQFNILDYSLHTQLIHYRTNINIHD